MTMMSINSTLSAIIFLISIIFPYSTFPSFLPQSGIPAVTQNFISPESGCGWGGVAGQVFGLDGEPSNGRIIEVRGEIDGEPVAFATTSGSSLQMGPGGFDIQLSDHPFSSQGGLYIQIVDPIGDPLTRPIYFETYDDCDKNLTIINFVEFIITSEVYFPLINR
jgi:hypothetical protein